MMKISVNSFSFNESVNSIHFAIFNTLLLLSSPDFDRLFQIRFKFMIRIELGSAESFIPFFLMCS